jgi:hypothetical protein
MKEYKIALKSGDTKGAEAAVKKMGNAMKNSSITAE